VEIAISVHQERLHDVMRSFRQSYVSRYFSAIAIAYASPSAGRRTILKVRNVGFSGTTVLTMETVCAPNDANSSTNVTQMHSRSRSRIFFIMVRPRKISSWSVVEVRSSFIMLMDGDVDWSTM